MKKKINKDPPPRNRLVIGIFGRHPYFFTLCMSAIMLAILQGPFLSTGDAWAESWYEYVHGAFVSGWSGIFQTGIAGYYNFLPKLISYPYVLMGMPLEYIDVFFRYAVVAFVIACCAFIAHPYNRPLIRSDFIRSIAALGFIMVFDHISSFSIINAWYAGFLPIVLVSISPHRFTSEIKMIVYASFALAICLTKPSIILLPAVIYRAVRHKEYLLGFIVMFGIALQSLLFLASGYLSSIPPVTASLAGRIVNTLLYPGLLLFKSFGVMPFSILAVAAACLLIAGLAYGTFRRIGFVSTAIILAVVLGASYTSLYAPDSPAPSVFRQFESLYNNDMKLQRELVIRFLLLILIFIPFGQIVERFGTDRFRRFGLLALSCILVASLYKPIDVTASPLASSVSVFRDEIRARTVDCMPIPPNVLWGVVDLPSPAYPWYFERHDYGTCGRTNYTKQFHRSSIRVPIARMEAVEVRFMQPYRVTAFSIPLRLHSPNSTTRLRLTDSLTGEYTEVDVAARQFDPMANPVFNLKGFGISARYRFVLTSTNPNVFTGTFDDGEPLAFVFFALKK